MEQLLYAMQFRGQAQSDGETLLRASTQSPGTRISSTVGPTGLASQVEPGDGSTAEFTSEVRMTGDTSFVESGTIQFGEGNSLQFSTIGEGYMGLSPHDGLNHGSIMWRVDGGNGQFQGATGIITSNFTFSSDMQVTDHHFGVIWVQ